MSKVVKGIKKGFKKVGNFVKDNWKPIAMAAGVAFTGGLATVGFGGLSSAIASNGILGGIGSTMWAGATAAAGTLGIGSGAAGTAAAASGMTGAGLFSGAAAGALGLPTVAQSAGGMAQAGVNAAYGSMGMSASAPNVVGGINSGLAAGAAGGAAGGAGAAGGGGGGLLSSFGKSSLAPALVKGAAGYFGQRAAEEDRRPDQLWGVEFDGDGVGQARQPWGDQYQPARLANQNASSTQPLLNYRNFGQYG